MNKSAFINLFSGRNSIDTANTPNYPFERVFLARVFDQHILFGPNEGIALIGAEFVILSQKDRLFRAGLFAEATENAPEQIYFVHFGFAFAIGGFLWFHKNGIGWTSGGAETTADASLRAIVVTFEKMSTAIPRDHRFFLGGVTKSYRLLE